VFGAGEKEPKSRKNIPYGLGGGAPTSGPRASYTGQFP